MHLLLCIRFYAFAFMHSLSCIRFYAFMTKSWFLLKNGYVPRKFFSTSYVSRKDTGWWNGFYSSTEPWWKSTSNSVCLAGDIMTDELYSLFQITITKIPQRYQETDVTPRYQSDKDLSRQWKKTLSSEPRLRVIKDTHLFSESRYCSEKRHIFKSSSMPARHKFLRLSIWSFDSS